MKQRKKRGHRRKMTTEITRKQAILLAVLGVVLVVICYVQFLIRPMLSSASETKEQIEELTQQYESLIQQGNSYDQNIQALEGWKEENGKETRRLYPLSDTQRIDRFLTFVFGECDVIVNSLAISDVLQYYVDGEGNLVTADPDMVSENQENASADTSASADSSSVAETASYTATGEYRCDFTYTLEGNYEDIVQLLNFVNRLSFLGVTSFSFQNLDEVNDMSEGSSETQSLADWYSFTLTITAYMYEDPLQTEEETAASDEIGTAETATIT